MRRRWIGICMHRFPGKIIPKSTPLEHSCGWRSEPFTDNQHKAWDAANEHEKLTGHYAEAHILKQDGTIKYIEYELL